MNKKICFVTTGDIKNIATAKRALGLANPLSDLGWKVSIIMEDTPTNRERCGMECDERTNVLYLQYHSARDEIKKKNETLKELKPDYIYLCALVIRNWVKKLKGCKLIVENCEISSQAAKWTEYKKIPNYFLEYFSLFYADGTVNASHYLQQLFMKRQHRCFLNKPMLYSQYAFNNKLFRKEKLTPCGFKWVKKEGDIFFTYLGSLSVNYGSMMMAQAVQRLLKDHRNVFLLLLGKGDNFSNIKDFVLRNHLEEHIWLPGYVAEEEIPAYFTMTDAFLLPMRNTVLDIARCPSKLYMYIPYERPIITCKVGEPYQVLGNKGIYYSPGNLDSLCAAMSNICEHPNKQLDINPTQHSWTARAKEFDYWIDKNL